MLTKGTGRRLVFLAYAEVEQVSTPDVQADDGTYQTGIATVEWVTLAEGLSLSTLRYSLTVVRNLEYPERHFRFGYRRFPIEDFETLKSAEVFVSRTAYYELLVALPEQLRNGFLAEEVLSASSERGYAFEIRSFEGRFTRRLRRLYEFVLLRVVSVGVLLEELGGVIEQIDLRGDSGVSLTHMFVDDDQQGVVATADNILAQRALFRELMGAPESSEGQGRLAAVESVLEAIAGRDGLPREAEFERLFRNVV